METAEEAIHAQERDPHSAFANRVRELNYGNSYFFMPIKISDLRKAGIPKPPGPILHFNRDELRGLPFTFPASTIRYVVFTVPSSLWCFLISGLNEILGRLVVVLVMVEAQCSVQLTFPVELKNGSMIEEVHFVGFLSKLLETKIMQAPLLQAWADHLSLQVDIVLNEISRLQEEGPSEQDVSTILEIEQQAHENDLQPLQMLASVSGAVVLASSLWRYSRHTLKS
ncbi:hypothetical protein IFM89_024869 [Coptis chinensis]|uniref:Uncharacterized protein n=1 Tax=Coptis chinensis TaxID=261450 RepID=A0A835HPI3_9MAGN|nr:hypothetical protein IFM89_024869 [Coptis chinensis]